VEFLPQGSTINAGVYCDILNKLCRVIQNKQRGMLSRVVVMLHDNAHPHTAAATQDITATFGLEQFDHHPYSPHLAPSDFHVFLHLKTFLDGLWFHDNEVKEAINMWFASQAASFYDAGIQKLVPHCECLNRKPYQKVVYSMYIKWQYKWFGKKFLSFQQPIRTYFLDNPRTISPQSKTPCSTPIHNKRNILYTIIFNFLKSRCGGKFLHQ
jgi:hypothetical protein